MFTTTDRSARSIAAALARGAAALVAMAGALFVFGFVVFAFLVASTEEPADPRADAIVALTGGRDRVAEAIDLLSAGRGRRLLISGVHPQTRAIDIQKMTESDRAVFACCIDLGRMAQSTAGNAEEAAEWVKQHGFTSLIVVTSAYHMPRSLVELDRALPEVRKVPFAVSRPDLNLETWYLHPATAKLLFGEYLKYIVARFAHQAPTGAVWQTARLSGAA
ncbi:MAG: YdcF family protein [Hyphomicrobiales bacterium]|nr:YdcF family protein [Hyphomicrobiales bacterium]